MTSAGRFEFIDAGFPAEWGIRGGTTTRTGGASEGAFASLNLATHVGDDPNRVQENRRRLITRLDLPARPVWLDQCHGTRVAEVGRAQPELPVPRTDAAACRAPGQVLSVLTADCLPVLLCAPAERVIAVAHAGWRGLAAGVLENTLEAMGVEAASVHAWLGPAIGAGAFEVGEEVRSEFVGRDAGAADCFAGHGAGKWLADLDALAKRRLAALGVAEVSGGGLCTFSDRARFYSYRRDGTCGRMASLLWME